MAKEFKTLDQLVDLLISRGVSAGNDAREAIMRESYYAIVNGYKDPFLDKKAMQSRANDVYAKGTRFQDIYNLFLFDRRMRLTVFPYLAQAESIMKNAVVYSFCEANQEPDSYLERSAYANHRDMLVPKGFKGDKLKEHSANMARLMKIFNGKLSSSCKRDFVAHYLDTYGKVPLWVLQNDLTFGNLSHFYQLQKRSVQNSACKIVGEVSGTRMNPHDLLRAFTVLVGFRNICAHDERLYCAEVAGANFSDMASWLRRALPKESSAQMELDIDSTILAYHERIPSGVFCFVSEKMGLKAPEIYDDNANITVTIPAWLNARAVDAGVNFSQTMQSAIKAQLGIALLRLSKKF